MTLTFVINCNCGGAVVYWFEPLTLDERVPGSIPVNAWHFLSFSVKKEKMRLNHERSFFENRRNCSQSEL